MAHDPDSAHAEAEGEEKDRAREERARDERGMGARLGAAVRELVVVLAMALTLSFIVKSFLVQAFFIPSESMQDTLLVGDRVVVSKLTPGPFDLERGDIVVFEDPGDWLSPTPEASRGPVLDGVRDALMFVGLLPDTSEGHLIKRVIGLPGDRVQCCGDGGRIMVNGQTIDESLYIKSGSSPSSVDFDITVPAGSVWVMGDNRDDSSDSRFHDPSGTGSEGGVPVDLVVGKAEATVWPFDRFSRLSNHPEVFADVPQTRAVGQ